jgi:AcrR family transcriptional regulator
VDKALPSRRDELLELAATMFAERGLRATTVRDIADSAGILSGSLYHHFKSKEQMVEEVLREFLDWLFGRYQEIVDKHAESPKIAEIGNPARFETAVVRERGQTQRDADPHANPRPPCQR